MERGRRSLSPAVLMAPRVRERRADGVLVGAEAIQLESDGDRGVLLVHGFNDTPQSVRAMAQALHAAGWAVHVPLLPAHGRTPAVFTAEGRADAWIAALRTAWSALRARYPTAVLAGQSMGGALAVILAAEAPPKALVLLAPYLHMRWYVRWLSWVWPLWSLVMPRLHGDPERGLLDPDARARALGGESFTPRMVAELRRVIDKARGSSPRVRAPVLTVHARRDYRISSPSALRGFARLGSVDKTLVWRNETGHVVAADRGREEVFGIVLEWLARTV
jgi:carboxylesterase